MLLFKNNISCYDPFNIIFLCGSKFERTSKKEKRIILKDYLSNNLENCQSIILEEHFSFSTTSKHYLAYDNIFLKNLSEVEKLASLYADKIIIIHETISTAAEIGMLAGNTTLIPKICILVPDDISIEENKVSSFIRLAFFNDEKNEMCHPQKIVYYPDIEIHKSSEYKSEYYTYFHENRIGKELGTALLSFVSKNNSIENIVFKNTPYNKPLTAQNTLSYAIDHKNKKINAYVFAKVLRIQLLSMFTVREFKENFRLDKYIKDHVTYFENNYKKILLNSICYFEGLDPSLYSFTVNLNGTDACSIRQAIGYFLYMLQAIDLIKLEQPPKSVATNCRKITISEKMESYIVGINDYLHEKPQSAFGGIIS